MNERGSPVSLIGGRVDPLTLVMFIVYILQSLKDSKTYVGHTNDFERRFNQHNLGQSKSTKHRAPFQLLIKEEFDSKTEAKKSELWCSLAPLRCVCNPVPFLAGYAGTDFIESLYKIKLGQRLSK